MANEDEIVYVTCLDTAKPETAEDRSSVFSANGKFYVFSEDVPTAVPKKVLKMFQRARNVIIRTSFNEQGMPVTQKISSTRYHFTEHDAPAAV